MKKLALVIPTLYLTACVSAPGLHMDTSGFNYQPTAASGQESYQIVPITQRVVSAQQVRKIDNTKISLQNAQMVDAYNYRVKPYDILSIVVFDHPELTTPAGQYRTAEDSGFVVSKEGTIFFPYVGFAQVAGKTPDEIRFLLTNSLARYIRNPQVSVRIASYRSQKVNITGEVKKPGILQINDVPLTVADAINRADGITPEADLQNVILIRGNVTRSLNLQDYYDQGDNTQNELLQNGDVINVLDRNKNKIYVLGEVKRPAAYLMHKGSMSLAEALGNAEWLDQTSANAEKIYVIRNTQFKPVIYQLNGNAPIAMALASQFQLQPQDVVYVSSARISNFGRIMGNIMPSLQTIYLAKPSGVLK